jgi:hypothetical protein
MFSTTFSVAESPGQIYQIVRSTRRACGNIGIKADIEHMTTTLTANYISIEMDITSFYMKVFAFN